MAFIKLIMLAICINEALLCTPPAQQKTMNERLVLSDAVVSGTVITISDSGLSDKDVSLNVTCILKNANSISIESSIVIREDTTSACPTNNDLLIIGNEYMIQISQAAGGRFSFNNINAQAASHQASQSNLQSAESLNGFESPAAPPGGDSARCVKTTTTTTTTTTTATTTTPMTTTTTTPMTTTTTATTITTTTGTGSNKITSSPKKNAASVIEHGVLFLASIFLAVWQF